MNRTTLPTDYKPKSKFLKEVIKKSDFNSEQDRERISDLVFLERGITEGIHDMASSIYFKSVKDINTSGYKEILKELDPEKYKKFIREEELNQKKSEEAHEEYKKFKREQEKKEKIWWDENHK